MSTLDATQAPEDVGLQGKRRSQRATLNLNPRTWQRARIAAAVANVGLTDMLEFLLNRGLADFEQQHGYNPPAGQAS